MYKFFMHETGLIKDLLVEVEKKAGKENIDRVSAITVEVSCFAGLNKKHFREHFDSYTKGTSWQKIGLKIKEAPYGAPLTLTGVHYDGTIRKNQQKRFS